MRKIIFFCAVSLFMMGCALTTERIDIAYTPQALVIATSQAKNVIVNVLINDGRIDKSNKVSCKKNGFGMEMAPILANEEVTTTTQRAIEVELKNRGFILGDMASVYIIGELNRFYNDYKIGFWAGDAVAEFNMSIIIKKNNGNIVYFRNISAQGVEMNTQLATGNNARLALNNALKNGLKILFEDQKFLAVLIAASVNSTP